MNIESLKPFLGDEPYQSLYDAIKAHNEALSERDPKRINFVNLAEGNYVKRSTRDDEVGRLNNEIGTLKSQAKETGDQLTELQKSGITPEALEKQIGELGEKHKADLLELEQDGAKAKLDYAVKLAITKSGPVNEPTAQAIQSLLDYEIIKMDGDSVLGLTEQLASVKEQSPHMFSDAKPIETHPANPQKTTVEVDEENLSDKEFFAKRMEERQPNK